ncbi:MAG: low molecular weight phosphotyrosine protein phosphatase [Treponemataceae bacterium]|nr:low molecular weight phosphotyrosine protein phosphatase [Treponemataceae bacterium]
MIKIMFVCHGNICRSTMAEFVMKDLVRQAGREDEFLINSSATSREEIGNDIHYGTRQKLREMRVPFERRAAVQLTEADCREYDYVIGMDYANIRNILRIGGEYAENKTHLLLEFAPASYKGGISSMYGSTKEIDDPWYTGNFDQTYNDVLAGCIGLLAKL